jgi:hypothetical protein
MPRTTPASPPACNAEAVRLVRGSERSLPCIAKDLGVADHARRNGVPHAESDDGARAALAPSEREVVRTPRHEREIRNKAAACFATERDAIRERHARSSRRRRSPIRWPP